MREESSEDFFLVSSNSFSSSSICVKYVRYKVASLD